jgi:hypothetical protein
MVDWARQALKQRTVNFSKTKITDVLRYQSISLRHKLETELSLRARFGLAFESYIVRHVA